MTPEPEAVERWLSADEAASMMGVSKATVLRGAKAGTLPHLRVGAQYRFLPSQLVMACTGTATVVRPAVAAVEDWMSDLDSLDPFAA